MKRLLLLSSFIIGCSFFSLSTMAQNVDAVPQQQASQEQTETSGLEELLKNVMVAPQPNRAEDTRKARAALKKINETENPFRPSEIITRNEKGELFMKYTYTYDEKGTFYTPGQSMIRDYKQWNKTDEVWDNNMRFRLIFDENGDMVEAFTDNGYKTHWDNSYRVVTTFDDNHNQLTVNQEQWIDDKWYSTLRWTNKYDANGNVVNRIYENRPIDGEWAFGLKQTWTYDDAGRELSNLQEQYSAESGTYSEFIKNTFTYDEKGNQTSCIREQRGTPYFHQIFEYDDNNNRISMLEKRWMNEEWINKTHSIYTYDDQNREISAIHQLWAGNATDGAWSDNTKTTTQYINLNSNQIHYRYDSEKQTWVETDRFINTYNEKRQQTGWSQDSWNAVKNEWQTLSRDRYTYNENYNLIEKVSEAKGSEDWIATSKFNYEYDENHNGIKVMSPRKQTKEWVNLFYNNMNDEWACADYDSWIAEGTYLDLREYVKTTGVTLSKKSYELETELNVQLEANVLPADASNKEVYWSSSNDEIARVSVDGRVYGVTPGIATITARTLNGNFTADCEIKVVNELSSLKSTTARTTFTYENQLIRFNGKNISGVQINDVNGKILFRQNNGDEISTSDWDKGIYFMQLSDDADSYVYKLLVY